LTIQDDITHRSADIQRPDGLRATSADLFAHNEIVIDALAHEIWQHLIAATAWPSWYSNAANVVVNDSTERLAEGVSFEWTTFGLEISSMVAEFVPDARLGWYGRGEGLEAYHTWLLIPRERGTYIVMEEIGLGDAAKQLAETNPGHMHRGHDLWNISLKFLSETRARDAPRNSSSRSPE
jgi:hypothetical protein